jgi:hypothetical protein
MRCESTPGRWARLVVKAEWVSVSDRVPENRVEVLVFSDEDYGFAWYAGGEWHGHGFPDGETVLYWMPLPEPPVVPSG